MPRHLVAALLAAGALGALGGYLAATLQGAGAPQRAGAAVRRAAAPGDAVPARARWRQPRAAAKEIKAPPITYVYPVGLEGGCAPRGGERACQHAGCSAVGPRRPLPPGAAPDRPRSSLSFACSGSGHHAMHALFRPMHGRGVFHLDAELAIKHWGVYSGYTLSHPYSDEYHGRQADVNWTATAAIMMDNARGGVRGAAAGDQQVDPDSYLLHNFAPGEYGRRRKLEVGIAEIDAAARMAGQRVVYMPSCSYPCGFFFRDKVPKNIQRAVGNSPDLLRIVDAIERPHTPEGTYPPGRVAVLLLWRDPVECVASTTGRSGSRNAFAAFKQQALNLQVELMRINNHLAALHPATWARVNYTEHMRDTEGSTRQILDWLGLDPALAAAADDAVHGERKKGSPKLGARHAIREKGEIAPPDPQSYHKHFGDVVRDEFSSEELDFVHTLFYRDQSALWPALLRLDAGLDSQRTF